MFLAYHKLQSSLLQSFKLQRACESISYPHQVKYIFYFFDAFYQIFFSSKPVKYILLHFLFFEAIYFQSKFFYKLRYPFLRTSRLMRQTTIFYSKPFFSYYWFSYISLFFSLLRIFKFFLPMMWVFEIFDKCKNLNNLIMNYEIFLKFLFF